MMLEVLYDTATKRVRAWCGDESQFGNFSPVAGQEVVILPIDVSDIPESDWYTVDLVGEKLDPNPGYEPSYVIRTRYGEEKITGTGTIATPFTVIHGVALTLVDSASAIPTDSVTVSGITGGNIEVVVTKHEAAANSIEGTEKTVKWIAQGT